MDKLQIQERPVFQSPEEELEYLRGEVRRREEEVARLEGERADRESILREEIKQYKELPKESVSADYRLSEQEQDEIVLDLSPETHDKQMEELLGIFEERGLMNALSVAEDLHNPHLEDDFHRVLVQYVRATMKSDVEKKDGSRMFSALNMVLYEVVLPPIQQEEGERREKTLKELISRMEQFYSGMMNVETEKASHPDSNYFGIEVALPSNSEEISFFVAIPIDKKRLFLKQVLGVFPDAKIEERKDDYNVFNTNGVSMGSYAVPSKNAIFSLKTYDEFDYDPLNILLNVFPGVKKEEEEGVSVQFLVSPVGERYTYPYRQAIKKIHQGVRVRDAIIIPKSIVGDFMKVTADIFKNTAKQKEKSEREGISENATQEIEKKIATPVLDTNIRIVVSTGSRGRSERLLADVESAFNQFTNAHWNGISWKRETAGSLDRLFHKFSFRLFSNEESFPLSIRELASLFHFPVGKNAHPNVHELRAGTAPAPVQNSREGIILGENIYHGKREEVRFAKEDRVRHFYVIGQTGTGKTGLLRNMIVQDIANGDGVCMIDPHGSDIEHVLANIPKDRADDVIYFDPSYTARPMGLNMLEYDTNFPEQKTFVVNEMLSIFNKLFDMKVAGGPAFEQYFRNSALLVLEDPASGATLLEIGRVLADKQFRDMKLSRCKNPIIAQFWRNAEKTSGEQSLANFVPYITNKFDVFISNDIMRPIIAQEKSAFNFRKVMDERKILLVNLAKGRLGDINSSLLGLVLVGKLLMAALSRVDVLGKQDVNDFYLYIDEFQNVTTDSISTILSEARKYRLSLNIAHQFIAQLEEKIRDAVFGNVGSMAVFRVGTEDAEFLEKQFAPTFTAAEIMKIENRNAYVNMLIDGQPARPFNIKTLPFAKGNQDIVDPIKELSYLRYGRDRAEVEDEIMQKYRTTTGGPS